jgi:hypothetical protein
MEYHVQSLASADGDVIFKARTPQGVAEGSSYGAHAYVAVSKCADSIPLHRLESIFARAGCPIARSTIGSLFHRTALVLSPIQGLIVDYARANPYVHADETTLAVLGEGQCKKGWIWGLMSNRSIAYVFAAGARSDRPTLSHRAKRDHQGHSRKCGALKEVRRIKSFAQHKAPRSSPRSKHGLTRTPASIPRRVRWEKR